MEIINLKGIIISAKFFVLCDNIIGSNLEEKWKGQKILMETKERA